MAQQQAQKRKRTTEDAQIDEAPATVETADVTDTLAVIEDALDDQLDAELLAAMDEVLEENAEEFVSNFIQEGGQ